jgi:hypothetical protein
MIQFLPGYYYKKSSFASKDALNQFLRAGFYYHSSLKFVVICHRFTPHPPALFALSFLKTLGYVIHQ